MRVICLTVLLLSIFTLSNEAKSPTNLVPNMSRGFINQNLLDLLEELRIRMHMDMTLELGIPRLDPFSVSELDLGPILNDGEHVANGTVAGVIQFIGEGTFNIILHNPTIGIVGRLGLTETGSWTMPELRVNFTITRFEGGFNGLTSELINNLLNLSAPALLETAWPTLEPIVIEMIYELLGGAVNSMTIAELISLLSGNGLDWPEVEEQQSFFN